MRKGMRGFGLAGAAGGDGTGFAGAGFDSSASMAVLANVENAVLLATDEKECSRLFVNQGNP
jgi:hypothetical protein